MSIDINIKVDIMLGNIPLNINANTDSHTSISIRVDISIRSNTTNCCCD